MNKELDETFEKAKKEQQEKLEDLEKIETAEKPIVKEVSNIDPTWNPGACPYEAEHC